MHLLCQNILCIIFEVLFALINMCATCLTPKVEKLSTLGVPTCPCTTSWGNTIM